MTTQGGSTVTPTTATQTIITAGKYTTGDIKVAAVPTDTNNTFTTNGTKTPASGKWFSSVVIDVPVGSTINNQNRTITPSESQQVITASSGYTGLGTVTINAIANNYVGSAIARNTDASITISGPEVSIPRGYYADNETIEIDSVVQAVPQISVSSGGLITATATQSAGYVVQGTQSTTQQLTVQAAKTVTPNESSQTAVAAGRYTTGAVTVAAISSTYVGSGIATRSAADLTASGATVTVPAGYYSAQATKSVATVAQATPAAAITNSTGIISATATQGAGYVSAGTKTGTAQLTVQAGKTVTPTAANQTAVASYRWTTGTITVAAVPTDTNNTFSANGTYSPTSGKWFDSVTINVPSGVNNQAKTATPTTATQTIKPDSGYSGLSQVTVNAIPSNYITTSDANATASQILLNRTAYVNGSKITGSMSNNGATGTTITTQGGTYTIPAGYTSGGTVTASLSVSTITNGVLNVATVTETTGDYGVQASITIPAGYYNATTLSKVLSTVLPAPSTAITVSQMLAGYQAYNNEGQLLTGTMTNQED